MALFLLLLIPFLAHILMGAHLMFHGMGLFAFLTLIPAALLFVLRRWMVLLQRVLLVLWALEWVRAGAMLVMSRVSEGRPFALAAAIMGGTAAFTLLTAAVFSLPRVRRFYERR